MVENGINIKATATRDSVPKFCVMAIKLKISKVDDKPMVIHTEVPFK